MAWPTYDTTDDVPEAFRDEYHEKDGKWVVKEKPAADETKLEKALASQRLETKAAEKAAKEAKDALEKIELDTNASAAGLTDEKLAEIIAQSDARAAKKYHDYDERGDKVRSLQLDSKVRTLALENGVRPETINQWWKLYGDRFDLTDDDSPIIKANPTADLKAYITGDLKDEFKDLYVGSKGDGGGGGGTHDLGGGGGGKLTWDELAADPTRALGGVPD